MCQMNVTHSRWQFELGGGDVWADKWTACFCSFYFVFFTTMMDDKINRQREPLMIAQDRADTVPLWRTLALCRNKDAQCALRKEKMPE